jgi:hypothetical protein
MRADLKAELPRIGAHQLVDAVRRDRAFQPPGAVVADRPKQRTRLFGAMAGRCEILVDERVSVRSIPP